MPYDVVMRRAVAQFANSLGRTRRQRFEQILDSFGRDPHQRGNFTDRDKSGRINEVKVVHDLMITFWTDHATKEVRVIELELIDE